MKREQIRTEILLEIAEVWRADGMIAPPMTARQLQALDRLVTSRYQDSLDYGGQSVEPLHN